MRCGCTRCGAYMIQSDGSMLGCVCPECGSRCTACLGTDCVLSREELALIKNDPLLTERMLDSFDETNAEQEYEAEDGTGRVKTVGRTIQARGDGLQRLKQR